MEEPNNTHIEITKKWIKKRPAQYKRLIKKCKELVEQSHENHYMIDIISNLVWNDVIDAERFMADSFCSIINDEHPEFFVVAPEMKASIDITLSQFMDLVRSNNMKMAV